MGVYMPNVPDDLIIGVPKALCVELLELAEARSIGLSVDIMGWLRSGAVPQANRDRERRRELERIAQNLIDCMMRRVALFYQGQPAPDLDSCNLPTLQEKLIFFQREGVRIRDLRLAIEGLIKERMAGHSPSGLGR